MITTNIENFYHRERVIQRKRAIELQKLDNLIESPSTPLPVYHKHKKNINLGKLLKLSVMGFKQFRP